MGWSRVSDPSQVLKPGEEISVKVLQVDDAKDKISLGLKQLSEDPWSKVQSAYAVGQVVSGRVIRVAEFGAFIELEPGIEALAHVSTFPVTGRSDDWKTSVAPGSTASFEILGIDLEKKRIAVKLVPDVEHAQDLREYAEREEARPSDGFGSLADKLRGALGTPKARE
jgi:ribosomal protein S1